MVAGKFKRRMLTKRETTAVASANAAIAVNEPRSCQKADINSSAIQIVADAANHAVTGWPSTTLKPHPIMMIAMANVTRLSQRAESSILIASVPQARSVIAPVLLCIHRVLSAAAGPRECQAAGPGSPLTVGGPRFTTAVALRLQTPPRAISS